MIYTTLKHVHEVIVAYLNRLKQIESDDKERWIADYNSARSQFVECMTMMSRLNPELLQLNLHEVVGEDSLQQLFDQIRTNADRRYSLDFLATGDYHNGFIQDEVIEIPCFVPWHDENNGLQNFLISYNSGEYDLIKRRLNILIMNMLLGLPAQSVRLNVFDINMTGLCDLFTSRLDAVFYHDEIVLNDDDAMSRLRHLLNHMDTVMKNYGNLVAYNNRHHQIALPYEIVVLSDYPHNYDSYIKQLLPLFEHGPKYGIYFVVLHNQDYSLRDMKEKQLTDIKNYEQLFPFDYQLDNKSLIHYSPFCDYPLLTDACLEYLNRESFRQPARQILKQDFSAAANDAYEQVMSEISVTIGLDINKKKEVTIRFNSGDYIHAFILGQSGSGKSVLLNNIITSAINKYAPEDLMLYLMDFKGVEFNRYRGIKHAKAILVDNSDPQMTLEILRELKEENRRRVKLWQAEGVNNIDGYNRKFPDSRVPQILFVADECQVMFSKPNGKSNSYAMQREIAEILNIIATQGRSQGIHMLLATQTLDNTDISGQILKNLTECFLLMCAPSDSNILVPDSGDLTAKQPTGQCCYYHKKELVAHVQTFYAKDEELEQAITASQTKAKDRICNGAAYFRGSSTYELNDSETEQIKRLSEKCPIAAIGHNIGLSGDLTTIRLRQDFSENILMFGVNKQEQTVGVTINALMSLIISYRQLGKSCEFKVIDCLANEEGSYRRILEAMQEERLCTIVERADSGKLLQQLVNDLCAQTAKPTVLTIIGSERFAEIKRKTPLASSQSDTFDVENDVISMDFSSMRDLMGDANNLDSSKVKTYPDALMFILDEGPMQDVHVLLQVDKPENILFEGEFCTDATDKFRHKVILRTENKYILPMRFSEDIDVETLGEDEERLRGYYYPDDGRPQLFTPYIMPKTRKIINTLTITTTIKWEQQIVQ